MSQEGVARLNARRGDSLFVAASRWGCGFFVETRQPAAIGSHLRQPDAGFHEPNGGYHESSPKTGLQSPEPAKPNLARTNPSALHRSAEWDKELRSGNRSQTESQLPNPAPRIKDQAPSTKHDDGTAQRGATQTANGKRTFLKWAQDYIVLPTVRVPDHWDPRLRPGQPSLGSGAVITTRGLDSAIRGVLVGTKRPDLVIIDDRETRDSARSGVGGGLGGGQLDGAKGANPRRAEGEGANR